MDGAGVGVRFDIVGFDPRGVGQSSPIRCFDSFDDEQRFLAGVPPFPVGHRQQVAFMAKLAEFGQLCLAHNATIMAHMSTANVARDLDLLRQAVGDAGLAYEGISYGSYLGVTYANLFPDRVRAIMIDSIVEPVAYATGRYGDGFTVPYSTRLRSDQGASETLGQFLALCDQAGPQCAFSPGGAQGKFATLLARAKRHPITLPTPGGPVTFSYADIVALVVGVLEAPAGWPVLAALLQALYTGSTPPALPPPPPPVGYDNSLEAKFAVACTDTNNPDDPSAWPRAARRADRLFPCFGAFWTYDSAACAAWPARDADRYTGPFTHPTSAPVLVVGTRFDPATRYQNAQITAGELPGARLLTLDGWGHGSQSKSSCIVGYVARYLLDQALPPPGTVCRPDTQPFQPPPTTAATGTAETGGAAPATTELGW